MQFSTSSREIKQKKEAKLDVSGILSYIFTQNDTMVRKCGFFFNIFLHFSFQDGKVPLCLAAGAGHYDVLNYLLKKEHDTYTLMNDSNVSACHRLSY